MTRQLVYTVTVHDCIVREFSVSGAGGQRRDKKKTGIEIIHPPSGAVGRGTEQRSQRQNKKVAWRRMCETDAFRAWVRKNAGEDAKEVAKVESMFWGLYGDVRIEYRVNGEWVEAKQR